MVFRMTTRFAVAVLIAFGISTASSNVLGQSRTQTTQTQTDEEFFKGAYIATKTPGLHVPEALRTVQPKYTSDAMRAKIQGKVEIQAVVLPNGTVDRARVVTSLDTQFGLDDEALKAIKQWTFLPGKLEGVPVTVGITLFLEFRLH